MKSHFCPTPRTALRPGAPCAGPRVRNAWNVAPRTWRFRTGITSVGSGGISAGSAGGGFNDRSETFLESSKVRLPKWIYVLREMDKGRSINSIAEDLPHRYKTVHGMATTIREAIYQRREEWREVLTGEVEASGRPSYPRPARSKAPL